MELRCKLVSAIPDAVLAHLKDKRDLGIHSELFSDGVIDLAERGVITNEKKTLHPGRIIAGFSFGPQRLYDFVNDNALIELHPTDYVNDPFIIAKNDRMIAINSALEVDLTGQVCADSIGSEIYSAESAVKSISFGARRVHEEAKRSSRCHPVRKAMDSRGFSHN